MNRIWKYQDQATIKYLSDEEIDKFFASVKKGKYAKRDSCLFHLMLSYGLRESEAISIRIEDLSLDPKDPQILIRRVKQRNKKNGRWYDLSKENYKRIKAWIKEREKWPGARSDYLFITQKSRGKYDHMSHEGLYGLVKKYGKEAGIPDIYPHMFRHTTGARLARAGLNAFTIQRRLGHSNVVSSQLYVDLAGPDRKAEDGRCEEAIGY
jgi:type 1 fimbriae regulatory protein FimB